MAVEGILRAMHLTLDIAYHPLHYVVRERIDPLLSLLLIRGYGDATAVLELLLIVAGIGCCGAAAGLPVRRSLAVGTVAALALWFSQELDPFFLKWHVFPFLCAALVYAERRRTPLRMLLLVLLLALWCWSAGPAALCGVLLAVPAAALLRHGAEGRLGWAVLLIGALLSLLWLERLPLPQFPEGARVTAISPFDFYHRPLLGMALEPNPLDYQHYRRELAERSFRLLLIVIAAAGCCAAAGRAALANGMALGTALAAITLLVLCGELLLPPALGSFAPFPVLARIVPGAGLLLPWMLVPGGVLLASFCMVRQWPFGARGTAFCVVALAVGCIGVALDVIRLKPQPIVRASRVLDAAKSSPCRLVTGPIRDAYGDWIYSPANAGRALERLVRLKQGEDFSITASASVHPQDAARAVDLDTATRWSTGRAAETGDWFMLTFDRPLQLVRVILSLGRWTTDFPAGIRIEGGANDSLQPLLELEDWPGPLRWTADGCPYYGPQSEVILDLPGDAAFSSLKFTQLGPKSAHDWSISEVKLYAGTNREGEG